MRQSAPITVVTSGHLSTTPRILKAADALHAAGYRIRVVSTRFDDWAAAGDLEVMASRTWAWDVVDYGRQTAPARWLVSGAMFRACRMAAAAIGPARLPFAAAAHAFGRVHADLVEAIAREPAALVYGGTTGGLAAVAAGAERLGVPYALDLEDYHLDQHTGVGVALEHGLAGRVLDAVLPGATAVTTASPEMRDAYAEVYPRAFVAICNTVPLPPAPPVREVSERPLRLYWFSQTIGPGRGVEDAVRAAGLVGVPMELHLRGRPVPGYLEALRDLQRDAAPHLVLTHHPPAPPEAMVALAREFDIGLSLETAECVNRAVCLGNKPLTYVAAGLAIAITDTTAQRPFAATIGPAAWVYAPGDAAGLAFGLRAWHEGRASLRAAQEASWSAAVRRWHWEHDADRGALLAVIAEAVGTAVGR